MRRESKEKLSWRMVHNKGRLAFYTKIDKSIKAIYNVAVQRSKGESIQVLPLGEGKWEKTE